jgi:hypothetical protein
MQGLALPAREHAGPGLGVDDVRLVGLRDRRKAHHLPVLPGEHMARQVVLVEPVHDQDDRAFRLVVETAVEGVVVPFVGARAARIRQGLLGLQRIVDHDQVGAAAGQDTADAGREATAARRRVELAHPLPCRCQARRKEPAIPAARDDPPAIARPFGGEILAPGLRSRRTFGIITRS